MENYPTEYVEHNTPLLLLSGLGDSQEAPPHPLSQGGIRMNSAIPLVDTPESRKLRDSFLATNAFGLWSGKQDKSLRVPGPVFRIKCIGRDYTIPPRKVRARPNASSTPSPEPAVSLHSPLSPLTQGSPLYPDGLFNSFWLSKHQDIIPSVFISCYELYTDTTDTSIQTQKDNELIKAINEIKKSFGGNTSSALASGETNFRRTKFVCIIVAAKSILESPDIEERLLVVRRSTNLDNNATFFYLPAHSSMVEIQTFVKTIQTKLFPGCLEYYRALSQRARRKKAKGPPPPITSPPEKPALTPEGWNCRYEFKLGVFAEFRQEMDAAVKHYESAYKNLLQGLSEGTITHLERWSEARMLLDIISIRSVRCLLWMENWTTAVRRWDFHVTATRDLLNHTGRGTNTYGFASWMSRWNFVFAELIRTADLSIFTTLNPPIAPGMLIPQTDTYYNTYAPSEKALQFEKVSPQHYLHHAGFYYLAAANYIAERHALITQNPAPSDYDDYMCPSPLDEARIDHHALQIEVFMLAKREFQVRNQKRMSDMVSHNIARLKMEKGADNYWGEALRLLKDISIGYRKEGWIMLLEEVLWRMVECAQKGGDGGQQVVVQLELLSSTFPKRDDWKYDLNNCLEGKQLDKKPILAIRAEDVIPFLSASYTFKSPEAHVGDAVVSQLVLTSNAQEGSAPVTFSTVKVTFEGTLKTILLTHDHTMESTSLELDNIRLVDLKGKLHEGINSHDEPPPSPTSQKTYLRANVNLSLYPGETKVIELSTILREAGDGKAMCATFDIVNDDFELELLLVLEGEDEGWSDELGIGKSVGSGSRKREKGEVTRSGGNGVWWLRDKKGRLRKSPIRSEEPSGLKILPKPPKMEVAFAELDIPAFVDEKVTVKFDICNDEDEEADASLQTRIIGYPNDEPIITWLLPNGAEQQATASLHPLGRIVASQRIPCAFYFSAPSAPMDCVIEVTIHYHLLLDKETPVSKTVTLNLPVVSPIGVTYDFSPRVHPDKWPTYFHMADDMFNDNAAPKAIGLTQRWCLTATIANHQDLPLVLEGFELPIDTVTGAECQLVENLLGGSSELEADESIQTQFILDIQKLTFEDRRASTVDVSLAVKWRRKDRSAEEVNTSLLQVPRLPVPGLEPRVLAVASKSPSTPKHILLDYSIENPTNYFLTFNIVMEANEAFAFSGPKTVALQLAPLSRHSLRYHIWPFVTNKWIKPHLRVEDRYFMKSLRCSAGGNSDIMGMDKQAMIVWVDDDLNNGEV